MPGTIRIENEPGVWELAESLIRQIFRSHLAPSLAIGAAFAALGTVMARAGWTVGQAEEFLIGSLEASFGTDRSALCSDGAAKQSAGRGPGSH